MTKWLRDKKHGIIYGWDEVLAENDKLELVTEEEAFPERFIPKDKKGKRSKKATLDLSTADIPQKPEELTNDDSV